MNKNMDYIKILISYNYTTFKNVPRLYRYACVNKMMVNFYIRFIFYV